MTMFTCPPSMTIDIWQDLKKKLTDLKATKIFQQKKSSRKETSMVVPWES